MEKPMSHTTIKNIILYADDDLDDQYIIQEAFRQFDPSLQVVCVSNGKKAMDSLEELDSSGLLPCLVILDINMPVQDGKKTLRDIRTSERFKHLPVVLFTTSSNPADERFASQHRAGFVTKPTAVNDLHSIATRFISYCQEEVAAKR